MSRIRIRYCTQCNWMLRFTWYAQELLHSLGTELESVALEPGTGGVFEIWLDDTLLWERKRDGGFPDVRVLKQHVRDAVAPDKSLGHTDKVGRDDD